MVVTLNVFTEAYSDFDAKCEILYTCKPHHNWIRRDEEREDYPHLIWYNEEISSMINVRQDGWIWFGRK